VKTVSLHDKGAIESFLRENTYLHMYSIGDLDDFFWQYTTWYGLKENDEIRAIALMYTGQALPTLLGLSEERPVMEALLQSIMHILPPRFYAHLTLGLEETFKEHYGVHCHGEHYKMALVDTSALRDVDCSQAVRLAADDLDEIRRLYDGSYPGNWFDPRMLETNQYFGIRQENRLVSVAGVHVYSERYRVAALGNITTHPDHRNQGYGKTVTARLCQSLSERVDHIGLNVKADNDIAISCYRKLGFETVASYAEHTVERK
jgi:GNAT superfamily N-acetyltransferase